MKNKKRYSFFFWLAISIILILNLLLWLYLNQVEERFSSNLKTRLLIENRSIARIINDEYLSAIVPGETNSLEYISLLQTLDDIRLQDSLQSILILTKDLGSIFSFSSIIRFVLVNSIDELSTRLIVWPFISTCFRTSPLVIDSEVI